MLFLKKKGPGEKGGGGVGGGVKGREELTMLVFKVLQNFGP